MARRRLSDMLREEVKRSTSDSGSGKTSAKKAGSDKTSSDKTSSDKTSSSKAGSEKAETPASPAPTAQPKPAKAKAASNSKTAAKPATTRQSAAKRSQTSAQSARSTAPATRTSTQNAVTQNAVIQNAGELPDDFTDLAPEDLTATIAPLQETIAILEVELQGSRQTEVTLRQEITDLQASLQHQEKWVYQLKAELEQVHHSQKELEEAKQLILKLSEDNIRLTQDLATRKSPASAPQPIATPAPSPPHPVASPVANSPLSNSATPRSSYTELRRILTHPIQVEIASTALSDADIGWVD